MKVLIGCEYSQIVTKAFREKGHEAYSCDIIPTEGNADWHIQGDILQIIRGGYDLGIFHPPCKYLSVVSAGYLKQPGRYKQITKAMNFFIDLYEADINKICIENPVGFINNIIKPTQIIHPYYFGDGDKKRTCLWLKNLPPLKHANGDNLFEKNTYAKEPKPIYTDYTGMKRYRTDAISGKDAAKERARFFPGIAKAMAEQWGNE